MSIYYPIEAPLRGSISLQAAQPLSNSSGAIKQRLQLDIYLESQTFCLAIKTLTGSAADPKTQYRPACFENWYWAPLLVHDSISSSTTRVLVNIQSLVKRLATIGIAANHVKEALKTHNLYYLLMQDKANKLYALVNDVGLLSLKANLYQLVEYIEGNRRGWKEAGNDFTIVFKGITVSLKKERILIWINRRPINFDSADYYIKTLDGKLTNDALKQIYSFMEKKGAGYIRDLQDRVLKATSSEAKVLASSIYLRPAQTDLARAIEITAKGECYIHFNKAKQQDPTLGKGTFKKVKTAREIYTLDFCASASHVKYTTDREAQNLIFYRGNQFFVQLHAIMIYPLDHAPLSASSSKKVINKARYRLEYYRANLWEHLFIRKDLTKELKLFIAKRLLEALAFLHQSGALHRDIKPQNVFLSAQEGGDLKVVLGDLGTLCEASSPVEILARNATTVYYAPPEYLSAAYELWTTAKKVEKMIAATNKALDIWSLGCTLHEMFIGYLPIGSDPKLNIAYFNKIAPTGALSFMKKPKNVKSIEHLIWEMIQIDASKRITAEEGLKKFNSFFS